MSDTRVVNGVSSLGTLGAFQTKWIVSHKRESWYTRWTPSLQTQKPPSSLNNAMTMLISAFKGLRQAISQAHVTLWVFGIWRPLWWSYAAAQHMRKNVWNGSFVMWCDLKNSKAKSDPTAQTLKPNVLGFTGRLAASKEKSPYLAKYSSSLEKMMEIILISANKWINAFNSTCSVFLWYLFFIQLLIQAEISSIFSFKK